MSEQLSSVAEVSNVSPVNNVVDAGGVGDALIIDDNRVMAQRTLRSNDFLFMVLVFLGGFLLFRTVFKIQLKPEVRKIVDKYMRAFLPVSVKPVEQDFDEEVEDDNSDFEPLS